MAAERSRGVGLQYRPRRRGRPAPSQQPAAHRRERWRAVRWTGSAVHVRMHEHSEHRTRTARRAQQARGREVSAASCGARVTSDFRPLPMRESSEGLRPDGRLRRRVGAVAGLQRSAPSMRRPPRRRRRLRGACSPSACAACGWWCWVLRRCGRARPAGAASASGRAFGPRGGRGPRLSPLRRSPARCDPPRPPERAPRPACCGRRRDAFVRGLLLARFAEDLADAFAVLGRTSTPSGAACAAARPACSGVTGSPGIFCSM